MTTYTWSGTLAFGTDGEANYSEPEVMIRYEVTAWPFPSDATDPGAGPEFRVVEVQEETYLHRDADGRIIYPMKRGWGTPDPTLDDAVRDRVDMGNLDEELLANAREEIAEGRAA